ncbi:MAG: hypothetical protein MUC65_05710 [Pontiellaceae bacterium]|jgi:hypothetical protein|nr:hypothetical protein [Pontiellaceae bacterium]
MLPQHGGVPNFRMRITGPILLLLGFVLITGILLSLSFHFYSDPGDPATQNKIRLSILVTFLLSSFILLVGTNHWWYPHLWHHGNSQKHHRRRTGHPFALKRSRRHHHRHHRSKHRQS